jgi:GxxExxY protein
VHELMLRQVPFEAQYPIHIQYKDKMVGEGRLDVFVDKCLIVELKAVDEINPIHKAQIMSYLRATKCQLGLLINFNVVTLKDGGIKRIIYRTS